MTTLLDRIKADREAGAKQEWSAERTACRDLPDSVWAIVWDRTPGGRKNDDGSTTYSLRFPLLLGTDWLADQEEEMTKIADLLNLAERAQSEITRLRAELAAANERAASYKAWDFPADLQAMAVRAESAEAREAKLREALEVALSCAGPSDDWVSKARAALTEKGGAA